jgi:predicted transcriptional regulator
VLLYNFIEFAHTPDAHHYCHVIEKLSRLGFSEKEAHVYLMLFRMGPSPVSALAQRVNLKRVTVYTILDGLTSRGLVNVVDTDLGRRYVPQDASCLLEQLEEEKNALQRKVEMAEECVRELENPFFATVSELKRVRFHEGLQAVKKGLRDHFMGVSPLNGLVSVDDSSAAGFCLQEFREERDASGFLTIYQRVDLALFSEGSLLVQEDTVGFLAQRGTLELMIIRDPFYAHYVKQVLFSPYFSKKSVGATISMGTPVKG